MNEADHEPDASGTGSLDELRARVDWLNRTCPSGEEEQAVLDAVRAAARTHPDFRTWLRDLPRRRDSARTIVYEALAQDVDAHGALLLEELDEALPLAEGAPDPRDVLCSFSELSELSELHGSKLRATIRDRLAPLLRSTAPTIRRWAIDLITDFLDPSDTELLLRVRDLMESDPDWRVRYTAHRNLGWIDQLPPDHQLGWMDRLRATFLELDP